MKRTILILCSLFCAAAAAAQPASVDSLLVRYRQMALEYNDDLKAAARNIEAGHVPIARRPFRPGPISNIRAIRWSFRPNCRASGR